MEKVKHKGGVEGNFGFLPKGIILAGVLRCGVLNEVVDQPEYIGVLADIAERVIAVGMARLDQIEHLDDVALLQRNGATARTSSPFGSVQIKLALASKRFGFTTNLVLPAPLPPTTI